MTKKPRGYKCLTCETYCLTASGKCRDCRGKEKKEQEARKIKPEKREPIHADGWKQAGIINL